MVDTWGWGGGGGGRDKWMLGLFQGCGVEHILFLLMWSSSRGVSGREWDLKKTPELVLKTQKMA